MIGTLLDALLGPLGAALGCLVVAVGAAWKLIRVVRKGGRNEAQLEAIRKDQANAQDIRDRGRARRAARASDARTPDQRLRDLDGFRDDDD